MVWTITKAAAEFGVSRETVRRGLLAAGVEVKRGTRQQFTSREILGAIAGDWKTERTRLTRAQREAQELENAATARSLVDIDEVRALVGTWSALVGQRIKALPSDAGHLANPTDPLLAREALQRWVDETLTMLQAEIK